MCLWHVSFCDRDSESYHGLTCVEKSANLPSLCGQTLHGLFVPDKGWNSSNIHVISNLVIFMYYGTLGNVSSIR